MIDRDQPSLSLVPDTNSLLFAHGADRFQRESIAHLQETLAFRRARLSSEIGQRALGAYSELGGGVETALQNLELTPFAEFIDGLQPRKYELVIGLADLRLSEVTPQDVRGMTMKDQRLYAAAVDVFVETAVTRAGTIGAPGSTEASWAEKYSFSSEQRAVDYSRELLRFVDTVKSTDLYDVVHHHLVPYYFPYKSQRDAAVRRDVQKRGALFVVKDTKPPIPKLRVQHSAA